MNPFFRAVAAYGAVVLWVLWIAASRIYLGLHTPIDILAGAVAGLTVVTTFISLEAPITAWVLASPWVAVPSAALVALVLLRLHPRPLEHTPTFEFTTSFMGVMFGVVSAVSRCRYFFLPPVQMADVWAHSPVWLLRRLVAGFALVLVCKEVSRAVSYAVLPKLYLLFPTAIRRTWQPPVHPQCEPHAMQDPSLKMLPHTAKGIPCDVALTSRFFAYAGIGFAACELAPRLFRWLQW